MAPTITHFFILSDLDFGITDLVFELLHVLSFLLLSVRFEII